MTETMNQGLSVRKEIVVKVPQEFAFTTYLENMGSWWPKSHHIGEADLQDVIIEKMPGGRWYEKDEDGKECDWGKLLSYDPYERILFQWQLDPDFKCSFDPNLYSEVEVQFEPLGPEETRVVLEHRKLENYGDAAEKMVNLFNQDNAWMEILRHFATYADSTKA